MWPEVINDMWPEVINDLCDHFDLALSFYNYFIFINSFLINKKQNKNKYKDKNKNINNKNIWKLIIEIKYIYS